MVFDVFCKKVPKKYPSKILRLFVILFAPEILFGKDCLCSIVLVRGSFQDNVAVFVHLSRLLPGSPGKGVVCSPSAHQSCSLYAIPLPQNRRTNDGRFHSRTTNKKNSKTNVRIIGVKMHIHTLTTTTRFFGYFAV